MENKPSKTQRKQLQSIMVECKHLIRTVKLAEELEAQLTQQANILKPLFDGGLFSVGMATCAITGAMDEEHPIALKVAASLFVEPPEVIGGLPSSPFNISSGIGDSWDKPYNWLIKGWMPADESGLIAGESTAGKTFAAIELMGAVAFGKPAFGKLEAVKNGSVLYCTGEGLNGLQKRLKAYTTKHSIPDELVNKRILQSHHLFKFSNTDVNDFIEHIKEIEESRGEPVELIIFDTFILYGGVANENSSDEVNNALKWMKELAQGVKASVMAIHHSGKGSPDNPVIVGSNMNRILRGSSDFGSSAEFVLGVCKSPIAESDDIGNALWAAKLKDAKTPEPVGFEIINHKLQLQDDVVEDVGVVNVNVNVNGSMTPVPPAKKRADAPKPDDLDLEMFVQVLSTETNKKLARKFFMNKLTDGGVVSKTAANRFTNMKRKALKDGVILEEESTFKLT